MKYKEMKIKNFDEEGLGFAISCRLKRLGYTPADRYSSTSVGVACCRYFYTTECGGFKISGVQLEWEESCAEKVTIDELMQMKPEDVLESPIAKGHNPHKLTEEQVGVADGWRLLESKEIADRKSNPGIEVFCSVNCGFYGCCGLGHKGDDVRFTYRTKQPEGYFLPKKEPVSASEVIAWAESQREWQDAIGEVILAKLKLKVALEKLKEASELRKETT